jgi:hypothetical protein
LFSSHLPAGRNYTYATESVFRFILTSVIIPQPLPSFTIYVIIKHMTNQPEPKYLDEAFEQICQELLATFIKKHQDYGKGNILSIQELGIAFRSAEKIERLKNLLMKQSGDKPANESIDDSWLDVAVYAVIAKMYRRGWFQKLELKAETK